MISQIYITKGDNVHNASGHKRDKMCGVVINDEIHWLDIEYAYLSELTWCLESLGVTLWNSGQWGLIDEFGSATLDKKVTRINKHHDDILRKGSSYDTRTKRCSESTMYWSVSDIKETYNI